MGLLNKIEAFIQNKLKIERLTFLNFLFGFMIAATPISYIQFANVVTSDTNNFESSVINPVMLFLIALLFLVVWIGDFWASQYRAGIIYAKRAEQEKKGVSLIGAFGYLHVITSLALAGVIGTLLGALINAIPVVITLLVIIAFIKEPILISKIIKSKSFALVITSKRRNILSDIILLLYEYLVFIISWQSFVISGNLVIDLDKSSGAYSMFFFVPIIYSIFYLGACWLWFEEITVNLRTRRQKLYFIAAFLFEVIMVIVKLVK